MPIDLDFAMRVHRMQRLRTTVEEVMEAHRMLALPVNDTMEPIAHRTDTQNREAEIDRMPLRMRKRIEDARRH